MITRDNYEAYYLDFLEGALSSEMEAAFLAFLEANPDLQIEDDVLPVMEADGEHLTFTEKELLKKEEELAPVSSTTIDFYLIAEVEGLLTPQQKERLTSWIQEHPAFAVDRRLYQHTIASADVVAFPNKGKLKQETRIIPLWLTTAAAAASIAVVVTLGLNTGGNRVEIGTPGTGQFAFGKPVKHQQANDSNGVNQQHKIKGAFGNNKKDQKEKVAPNENFKPIIEFAENPIPSPKSNNNGTLLPELSEQPLAHNHATPHSDNELNTTSNDNYVAWQGMTNPIEPITSTLSSKLNTTIDFRRKKESTDQKDGGFYLRIGKFELMHKKGGKH